MKKLTFVALLLITGMAMGQTNVVNNSVKYTNITSDNTMVHKAFDSNTATSFDFNYLPEVYITIALYNIHSINNISLLFGNNSSPISYEIWSSLVPTHDMAQYQLISTGIFYNGNNIISNFTFPGGINQHRYIKLIFKAPTVNTSVKLLEYQIMGTQCYTMAYAYDGAGNRVSRSILLNEATGLKSASIFDTTTNKFSNDFNPEKKFTDELAESQITIYPNPTRGEMVVQVTNIKNEEAFKFVVYDMTGKIVLQKQNTKEFTNIDLSNVPAGNYILKMFIGGSSTEWKIIKQ